MLLEIGTVLLATITIVVAVVVICFISYERPQTSSDMSIYVIITTFVGLFIAVGIGRVLLMVPSGYEIIAGMIGTVTGLWVWPSIQRRIMAKTYKTE